MTEAIKTGGNASVQRSESPDTNQTPELTTALFQESYDLDQSTGGRTRFNSVQSVESFFSDSGVSLQSTISHSSIGRLSQSQLSVSVTAEQQAVRNRVAEEYVLKAHMPAIENACRLGHFIVSIRNTGKASLDKLALGAPAKGHNILEKTIKEGSIRKNYSPEQADALLDAMKNADLLGYVGHWDETTGALLGVYVSPDHQLGDRVVGGIYKFDVRFLDGSAQININQLNASLAPLKEQENWQAKIFTGDYDMHDMIDLHGRRGTVPSNSPQERRVISRLNKEIAAIDPQRRGRPQQFDPFQHGSQDGYLGYTLEKKEEVVPAVAATSFPVAFFYNGEWTIVENSEQHAAFYLKINVNMKNTWQPKASEKQSELKTKIVKQKNKPNTAGIKRKKPIVANTSAKALLNRRTFHDAATGRGIL